MGPGVARFRKRGQSQAARDTIDGVESGRERAARLVSFLLGLFFGRMEVTGTEHVPESGGGILIAWHPNGLLDPALIISTCPRAVVFGARHGLFSWPIVGRVMKALGTVPI